MTFDQLPKSPSRQDEKWKFRFTLQLAANIVTSWPLFSISEDLESGNWPKHKKNMIANKVFHCVLEQHAITLNDSGGSNRCPFHVQRHFKRLALFSYSLLTSFPRWSP